MGENNNDEAKVQDIVQLNLKAAQILEKLDEAIGVLEEIRDNTEE